MEMCVIIKKISKQKYMKKIWFLYKFRNLFFLQLITINSDANIKVITGLIDIGHSSQVYYSSLDSSELLEYCEEELPLTRESDVPDSGLQFSDKLRPSREPDGPGSELQFIDELRAQSAIAS